MSKGIDGSTIAYIASFLQMSRAQGQKAVLILGSRTGALFRSAEFYDTMKQYALPSFDEQTLTQKFGTCYQLLTNELSSQEQDKQAPLFPYFDEQKIDAILSLALSKINISSADINLAHLIRLRFFDTVISTNVDDMLELAMENLEMEQGRDFYIYDPDVDAEVLKHTQQFPSHIMKVFGNFSLNNYKIKQRHNYLSYKQPLVNWLQDVQQHHLFVVGLDPFWDAEIFRMLSMSNEAFWSVDEKVPGKQAESHQTATMRVIWYVHAKEGSYEYFFRVLHEECSKHSATAINVNQPEHLPKKSESVLEKNQNGAEKPLEIYVSYAKADDASVTEVVIKLAKLRQEKRILIWSKQDILPGNETMTEVHSHLESAAIILLLVSEKFIDSKNADIEVERAMERHRNKTARVIPIILESCEWSNTPYGKLAPLSYPHIENDIRKIIDTMKTERSTAATKLQGKIAKGNFDVFLCHNHKDKPAVKKIGTQLKGQGILPWLDEWELRPGLRWQHLLEQQIAQIKAAAVFVGEDGVGPWERIELEAFLQQFVDRKCPVIPVILSDTSKEPELPVFLKGTTWVDFRVQDPDPMEQLIWGITGERGDMRKE